jgi:hypothetical protein
MSGKELTPWQAALLVEEDEPRRKASPKAPKAPKVPLKAPLHLPARRGVAPARRARVEEVSGKTVRVLSYGGGLDSMAMLLLAIKNHDLPDVVVFADVSNASPTKDPTDPGEWPSTYRHLREVVMPLCRKHGLRFVWLTTDKYPIRGSRSLFGYFKQTHSMPTRQSRLCTSASKVERVRDFCRDEFPGRPIEMWIGFEAGEEERAKKDPHALSKRGSARTTRFPLIEARICRCRAEEMVRRAGFPVPRKSACVFCPFSSRGDFLTLKRELPRVFSEVEKLEAGGKLTRSGKTLRYGYEVGDDTDPKLREWVEKSPYKARVIICPVCGKVRATKATGCDYLPDSRAKR